MITKYGNSVSKETLNQDKIRLINQLWKLIPMRENNEDWETHLDNLIIEISGLYMILPFDFLVLLSKLEGLKIYKDTPFFIYRSTIFKAISMIGEAFDNA